MTTAFRRIDQTATRLAMDVARRLPEPLVQPWLDLAMSDLRRRHARLFERLAGFDDALFAVDGTDLPLVICFRLGRRPRLSLRPRPVTATATVRGRFEVLLDLLEGRVDGDTLFFNRDLEIEGRTEIILTVRNTVDGENLDFGREVAAALGPLGGIALAGRSALARLLEPIRPVPPARVGEASWN